MMCSCSCSCWVAIALALSHVRWLGSRSGWDDVLSFCTAGRTILRRSVATRRQLTIFLSGSLKEEVFMRLVSYRSLFGSGTSLLFPFGSRREV